MRIGELAKKANISINALRYYDKEGLLSPSSKSESGYRLYNDQDTVRLIQIQTMKELGFTLGEIKKHLVTLDTPADMAAVLTEHEAAIEKRLEVLLDSLDAIKALKAEVMQMQTMDFKKYADILVNLQMKNDNYWVIKYMDNDVLDYLREHFNDNEEGAMALVQTMNHFQAEITQLKGRGVSPESKEAQIIAKSVMEMIHELTGGDTGLMRKFTTAIEKLSEDQNDKVVQNYDFLRAAVNAYFAKQDRRN